MTKTIEFIKKEIHFILEVKNEYEKMLNDGRHENIKDYIKTLIKEYEDELQTLHQVKCELEAWEVVKRELELVVKEDKQKYAFVYYWLIYRPYELLEIEKKDYKIIKKALEVENE